MKNTKIEQEEITKKFHNVEIFKDINASAVFLSQDVGLFLAEELDDLNVSSSVFRMGLERCFIRVLSALLKQEQSVMIFPDTIPGFTLMAFKLNKPPADASPKKVPRAPLKEVKENEVINGVISRFFSKNQQKVILIENIDILFALFPVADTKKNLKEAGLYITF